MGDLSNIIKHPTFKIKLPVLKTEVTIRPWTFQEEKILLMAKESNLLSDKLIAIKQVVNNCIISKKPKSIPTVDMDYLFLKLREKSVGSIINLKIKGFDAQVDLSKLKVDMFPNHSNRVEIADGVIVQLNYSTYDDTIALLEHEKLFKDQVSYEIMRDAIDLIITKTNTFNFKDYSKEEQIEFFDNLIPEQIGKIKVFFDTEPKLKYTIEYIDNNNQPQSYEVERIGDFF